MAGNRYKFDLEDFTFRKVTISIREKLMKVLKFFIATSSLAVLYYMVAALFISTDSEKHLKEENRLYARIYERLEERDRMLSSVMKGLEARDNEIYSNIFKTGAPSVEQLSNTTVIPLADTLEETDIALYASSKLDALDRAAADVEKNFLEVFGKLAGRQVVLPPMSVPVENFSYARCGASVGEKVNPFYKVTTTHRGLDIMSQAGEKVVAAADGTVVSATRSSKGDGNTVVLSHEGGFRTRYAHLADIYARPGATLRKGDLLGTVGTSGSSFAPHLHYEVWRDSTCLDPVDHLFASLGPKDYAAVAIMASSAGQSMD
ncbi:MAG: M23 family metallopeptidase [Bacteroidales bacterium]|nr:M23 family metallopeptidase [Bacteroidales bacterium]